MTNPDEPARMKDSAAVQFMILDLLDTLLTFSEDPPRMGGFLTRQLRELVGARIVALLQCPEDASQEPYGIVAIQPERYANWEHLPVLQGLARLGAGLEQSVLWQDDSMPPAARELLLSTGLNGAILSPLRVGQRQVGLLVALHLLDPQRNADMARVLQVLSPVAALVLKNALFMESQEQEIRTRTRELEVSERHFTTLADVAPVGIFQLDARGRLRFVNARWLTITGATRPPLGKAPPSMVLPEDRRRIYALWKRTRDQGEPFNAEYRLVKPGGEVAWVIGEVVADLDEAGRIVGFIGSLTDITERKQAEAERKNLEAQLTQAQKLESIGRLAGGVAHDINNTLTVILGNVEIMRLRLRADDPLQRQTAGIGQAVDRSRAIIQQLLAFSRKQVIEPKVMDLNARIAETQRTLASLIGEDIHLEFVPQEGLWPVRLDPGQLDQVVMNLAVNARDAMPHGGRLRIATENLAVEPGWAGKPIGSSPGAYVRLTVTDEGCGMDPETQTHIFEPFFSTKEVGKGTGLGLATVFGIVKQNGGFIDVYSEPGLGSTFRMYLPALSSGEAPLWPDTRETALASGSGTVLVVEDDPTLRELIPAMVEQLGYRAIPASGPEEALRACSQGSRTFDLLLTDVIMPGMSGRQLRDRILELRPGVQVLYMSGYTADIISSKGVLEEGVHFIQKPFTLKELSHKLTGVLGVGS